MGEVLLYGLWLRVEGLRAVARWSMSVTFGGGGFGLWRFGVEVFGFFFGFGFWVWGLGTRVWSLGFEVRSLGVKF